MAIPDGPLRRGCVCALGCLLVALPAGAAPPARVATPTTNTYVVNSALDEPDADAADGKCLSYPSGKCTLRAAIMESNVAATNSIRYRRTTRPV